MLTNNVPLERSDRGQLGVTTYSQDRTSEMIDVPFLNDRGTFQLAASTVIGNRTFTAVTGHGILVGEVLEFANQTTFMQAIVLNVTVDLIEIDTPFNHVYANVTDLFIRSSQNLRVDGSTTPMIFSVKPVAGQKGSITRIIIIIESASSMDFTKFGSLNALTNGMVLRIKRESGDFRNLMNFKSNGEFIEKSFDHVFQDKSGGGGFGFVGRSTFSGPESRGVVIRLDGDLGEELQMVVQDDLSTGLTRFNAIAQGSELQQ